MLTKHVLDQRLLTKKNNIALFDNLDLRKHFVEIDGQRYPRDSSLMNYEENDYIYQYKYLKILLKDISENQF